MSRTEIRISLLFVLAWLAGLTSVAWQVWVVGR